MTVCPYCHSADCVQKVSFLYSSGTSHSTTRSDTFGYAYGKRGGIFTGSTVHRGTHQTLLARKLAPPMQPASPHWLWYLIPFLPFEQYYFPIVLLFAPIERGIKQWLIAIVVLALLLRLSGYLMLVVQLDQLFLYFWGLYRTAQHRKLVDLPQWQQKMSEWNNLFYCSKDDCVFDSAINAS